MLAYLEDDLGLTGDDLAKVIKKFPEVLACRCVQHTHNHLTCLSVVWLHDWLVAIDCQIVCLASFHMLVCKERRALAWCFLLTQQFNYFHNRCSVGFNSAHLFLSTVHTGMCLRYVSIF